MTEHNESGEQNSAAPASQDSVNERRRRLLAAGASSSLLLTIASRSSWATGGGQKASAIASANASGAEGTDSDGVAAHVWETSTELWPISPDSFFTKIFGEVKPKGSKHSLYSGLTLGTAIKLKGGDPIRGKLALPLIGAYLNAVQFPAKNGTPGFYYTPEQIVDAYQALDDKPMTYFEALATTLNYANDTAGGLGMNA